VARIEQTLAATPGLFVTGSAFRGVGISDCVRQGREAADRALQYINQVDRVTADVNRQEATWTS
jgi:oxygen-dependent protoporphyrinogen oxidase